MILVDTNVLVALVLRRDALHGRAVRDLENLVGEALGVLSVVLAEACFLLEVPQQRERLREILEALRVRTVAEPPWQEVFPWLARYADHAPDWADACLVSLAKKPHRLWTYDKEFRAIWRRTDGSAIPLVHGRGAV